MQNVEQNKLFVGCGDEKMFSIYSNIIDKPIIFVNKVASEEGASQVQNSDFWLGCCNDVIFDEGKTNHSLTVHIYRKNLFFFINVNTKYVAFNIPKD